MGRYKKYNKKWQHKKIKARLKFAGMAITLIATGIVIGVFYGNQIVGFFTDNTTATEVAPALQAPIESNLYKLPPSSSSSLPTQSISQIEHKVMELVNAERTERNIPELIWETKLQKIAEQHSEEMLKQSELFHSSIYESYAENCWGGGIGSTYFDASDIVSDWMGSPPHRTWLLCPHLKHIGVGIVLSSSEMYASWTFWRYETLEEDWWYVNGIQPPSWLDLNISQ